MGMFDSVYVKCPDCEQEVEIQSKAGACILSSYTLDNAPPEILLDIANDTVWCKNEHTFYIRTQVISHASIVSDAARSEDDDY